jgi:uncharacterized protein YfaS (alpha-2-macroglobulin family)
VFIRLRVRTNGNMPHIENTAIIDPLPGAFELQVSSIDELRGTVYASEHEGRLFDYVDVREDRVIFYAPISSAVSEFTYRAKVVSVGEFTVPQAFAQAMYDPIYKGNTEGGKLIVGELDE